MTEDRLLAFLAHAMGELNKAAEHLEEPQVFCRKASYLPELAWTRCDYADTLLQRNAPKTRNQSKLQATLQEIRKDRERIEMWMTSNVI